MSSTHANLLSRVRPHLSVLAFMMLPSCGHLCDNIADRYTLVPGSYPVLHAAKDPRMVGGASVVVTDDTLRIEYKGDDGIPHFALYSYSVADTGTP
jgi:hypothetical protein